MMEYNLTQRDRQILIRLVELSRHTKDHFVARVVNLDAIGPSRELARLHFEGGGSSRAIRWS